MSRLGIIAAFPGELKSLTRGWLPVVPPGGGKGDAAWRGRIGPMDCIAVAAGMGSEAAARACAMAEAVAAKDKGLKGLVSLGWAGALSGSISPGQPYRLAEVIDAESGEHFRTSFCASPEAEFKLVSIDHVAQYREKRQLEERYGAAMVDMEAAAVAFQARIRSIPFYCLKAVSDVWNEALPDFSRFANPQGKLEGLALFSHLVVRPGYWPALARMSRNSRIGAAALAGALEREPF